MTDKPPYRVPSMDEIRAIPWNGFAVASTFSGCGGSSLGYRMAGFKVLYANEFVEEARKSYRANMSEFTYIDDRDIRSVSPNSLLDKAGLKAGDLDLLDGSPPCASFSTSGKRHKGWGKQKTYSDTVQRSDDLFFEFARLLKGVKPRVFVAENVSGLVKGTAKGYFLEILAVFKECGYRVAAKLLDAAWLGVPQSRQRLIFIGVRCDLNLSPAYPRPLPYLYTISDALSWVSSFRSNRNYKAIWCNAQSSPSPTVSASIPALSDQYGTGFGLIEADSDMSRYAVGKEWGTLKPGEASEKYFSLVRPSLDAPSPTITASGGNASTASVTHPTERRKFSIAELRRICGFPDDFVLTGTYAQQWERLGRAVPPVMMAAIATTIRDDILRKVEPCPIAS